VGEKEKEKLGSKEGEFFLTALKATTFIRRYTTHSSRWEIDSSLLLMDSFVLIRFSIYGIH
jgi:hypothetical protein